MDGMACATTRTEFDIFVKRPVQRAMLSSRVTHYKPIAAMDQSDLDYVIPSYPETCMDLVIRMSLRGKYLSQDGYALDPTVSTTVVNILLHSLFS